METLISNFLSLIQISIWFSLYLPFVNQDFPVLSFLSCHFSCTCHGRLKCLHQPPSNLLGSSSTPVNSTCVQSVTFKLLDIKWDFYWNLRFFSIVPWHWNLLNYFSRSGFLWHHYDRKGEVGSITPLPNGRWNPDCPWEGLHHCRMMRGSSSLKNEDRCPLSQECSTNTMRKVLN